MSAGDDPPGGYKLVLVPESDICGTVNGDPSRVCLTFEAGPDYEVVADVGPDKRIRMSRLVYDEVEVIEPAGALGVLSRPEALRKQARAAWAGGTITGAELEDSLRRIAYMEWQDRGGAG